MFTSVLRIPSLTCCCKRFRSFVLNTLHSISLHSGWQVRSFMDASSVSDHSFPRIKQSLLKSAQLLRMLHQPAFISFHSLHSFRPLSLNHFRNPTAAHSTYSTYMRVRLPTHCRTVASRPLAHAHFNATAARKSTVLPRHGLHPHSSSIVAISC